MRGAIAALVLMVAANGAYGSPCAADDFDTHVSGESQCLLMRRYGPIDPASLVVWLHGDLSSGDPATYHFPIAQAAAQALAGAQVLSVALVRPGYPDGDGEASSVAVGQGGRSDHYTKENIAEVGAAIEKLKARFKPRTVVLVGHSGGAATVAVLMGMNPQLAQDAVLVSCPCDLGRWRIGRRAWDRSENPQEWARGVSPSAHVVTLTGGNDDNTRPSLAQGYVDALKARGVDASAQVLPGKTHNSAFRSPEVLQAVERFLRVTGG